MTNDEKLEYARHNYPIGTKFRPLDCIGNSCPVEYVSKFEARYWIGPYTDRIEVGDGLIYCKGKWAEIIDEVETKETNMEIQKLSRKGLKEIHAVACSAWKHTLEGWGKLNPLEDYIELTQSQVDTIFLACTKDQLPIVSKYLKQDDGSVDLTHVTVGRTGIMLDDYYIIKPDSVKTEKSSFWLNNDYNWEVKKVSGVYPRLYITKKKQSLTSSGPSTGVGVVSTATGYTNSTTGKYSVGF